MEEPSTASIAEIEMGVSGLSSPIGYSRAIRSRLHEPALVAQRLGKLTGGSGKVA
jgi:hypothetical protein